MIDFIIERECVYDFIIERECVIDFIIERECVIDFIIERECVYDFIIERECVYDFIIEREGMYDFIIEREGVHDCAIQTADRGRERYRLCCSGCQLRLHWSSTGHAHKRRESEQARAREGGRERNMEEATRQSMGAVEDQEGREEREGWSITKRTRNTCGQKTGE